MLSQPKIKIIEPDNYSPDAVKIYESVGDVELLQYPRNELLPRLGTADVIVTRLGYQIDKSFLAATKSLKYLVTPTTGLNHVDLAAASKLEIEVLSLQGQREFLDTITATAEHTWALLLALVRQLPIAYQSVCNGDWLRDQFKGVELHGKTLGVLGLGRLGSMTAQYGKCFGMKVIAFDPNVVENIREVEMVEKDALFQQSDIVLVHAALTHHNYNIIGRSELRELGPTGFIINTARGELLDEAALLEALEKREIAGAALDVISNEQQGVGTVLHNSLVRYARENPNLLLTPHIGGATNDSMAKTEIFMATLLAAHFQK